MQQKSRAEYFRLRRKSKKSFGALLDREKVEKMEATLEKSNTTKAKWIEERIDEALNDEGGDF